MDAKRTQNRPKTAKIYLIADRRSGRRFWRVRYFSPAEGHWRSRSFTSRLAALEFRDDKRFELARHKVRWADFVTLDLESLYRTAAAGTFDGIERTYRYFTDIIRPTYLHEVNFAHLEHYRQIRLAHGASKATVNLDLRNLRAGLYRAVKRGHLVANPFTGNRQKLFARELEPVPRILEPDDVTALLTACPTEFWTGICLVAWWAGLRIGEILALEWCDIDFKLDALHVRNKDYHRTKSGKNRTIPLAPSLKRWLWKFRCRRASRQSARVFYSTSLQPDVTREVVSASATFATICVKAGLVDDQGRHKFTLHDLRRTCITAWLRAGVDPKSVQTLAGHQDVKTTLRHYAAVTTANLAEGIKKREAISANMKPT